MQPGANAEKAAWREVPRAAAGGRGSRPRTWATEASATLSQVLLSSHPVPTEQRGRKAQVSDGPCSPPFPLPNPGAPPDLSHPMNPSGSPASELPIQTQSTLPPDGHSTPRLCSDTCTSSPGPHLEFMAIHPQALPHLGECVSRQTETLCILSRVQAHASPRQTPCPITNPTPHPLPQPNRIFSRTKSSLCADRSALFLKPMSP